MKYIFALIIFLITLIFSIFYIYQLNLHFLECPNKDMLLWDANIRMIQAIDIIQYIKHNDWLSAIILFIDSPTWPPLRTLISIFIIIFNKIPDPILDTRVSIVFFIFTIFILFFGTLNIFYRQSHNIIDRIIIILSILITITFLFLLDQIPEYLFNSMLEIQGMMLYSLFLFLIYKIYHKNTFTKKEKIIFFIIGFLIYFTKYPYGVLVTITIILIELLRNPKFFLYETVQLIKHYRNYRIIFLFLPLIGITLILISPYLFRDILQKKFIKNLIYFSILIAFIEMNMFLYKNKIKFFSDHFRFFYIYFILPFSIIILSHPDRFHSLLGAQSDTIDRGRSFFISIFYDYFLNSYGFNLLILASFITIIYKFIESYAISFSKIQEFLKTNGIILILLFLWIHLLILEFLTTNHQARYIFQILPGLILFHNLVFLQLNKRAKIFILVIQIFILITNLIFIYKYSPSSRNTCFAGIDKKLFEPARIISNIVDKSTYGIIFNEFHEYTKYNKNLENPYLFIPTDIDVHLRYRTYSNGFLLNDSKSKKLPNNMKHWLYITNSCNNELFFSNFFNLNKYTIMEYKTLIQHKIDDFICFKIYEVEFK